MDGHEPPDLGYIKCEPCMNGDHDRCIGLKHDRPFCGCRCPWTETISEGDRDVE